MESGEQHKFLPGILQHHCELLQAILLTMSRDEWGREPLTPVVMEALFDIVPRLSDTFFMQRVLEAEGLQNDEEAMVTCSPWSPRL